jgi:predicted MPP superfamily phosphohydrolase
MICITGDLVNDPREPSMPGVHSAREFFSKLSAPHGIFTVFGDWDGLEAGWPDVEQQMFEGSSVTRMNDAIREVRVGDARLVVLGRAPAHLNARRNYMANLPADQPSVVLHHYPFGALRAADLNATLYLAGHTHGGQVRLPWIGACYRMARGGREPGGRTLPRRFNAGLHRLNGTWIHVSCGLGMRGGDAPPIRFCCRPELALLTFQSTGPKG